MQGLAVLGATGTIGLNTLDVAAGHPDRFHIVALSAHRDVERLAELCRLHRPEFAVVGDPQSAVRLREQLSGQPGTRVLQGCEGLEEVVALPQVDRVMAGIVGAAGLLPTLAAVRAGKHVLLANKEPLVMAGRLFMRELARGEATLLPVDSEHNAIFQCLPAGYRCGTAPAGVTRIILTASGGPFRELALNELPDVTPAQALRHPNWVMGPKISVDSATMMNKGLELIEASWLFGLAQTQIEVLLHPQSVVHSLVEFADRSQLAQLGQPDMRTPIAHALGWPERLVSGVPALDLTVTGRLDFGVLDPLRYPCLGLARQALEASGHAPLVLNAANEIAVAAFLAQRIRFTVIPELIDYCLQRMEAAPVPANERDGDELAGVIALDAWVRGMAEARVNSIAEKTVYG